MDWELIQPWVNRGGIMLEFLSFWFAAPEILGEERLRALERKVERGIRVLSNRPRWMTLGVAVAVGMVLVRLGDPMIRCIESAVSAVASRVVGKVAGDILVFVLGAVLGWVWQALMPKLQDRVLSPLLKILADDERIRQRSLAVGAVLFVVGFLLQFVATF
jgi:hypothetical protein